MTGTVTINGVTYTVVISDLTPAEVLNVFRTDTSIVKTDSILLHSAGAEQNSAKKVLLPHLISAMSSALAEDIVLTIEPYYNAAGEYQGMYWHYNRDWLRRADTGEMIRVDEPAAAAALSADAANDAADAANGVVREWTKPAGYKAQMDTALTTADQDHTRASQDHTTAETDHTQASSDHTRAEGDHTTATDDHSRAEGDHGQAAQDHTTALNDHSTAGTDHTRAEGDHTTAEADHSTAGADHTQAGLDHAAALLATAGAENVNAELDGMKVKITDREGVTRAVDISLDFYKTYASVAAMNADASSIPECSLVSIATDNPTSAENARVYQKRSDGTMKYLFDLDQASAAAWADWLENKKPEIEAAVATAASDHTRAEGDHSTAGTDHTRAEGDHTTASADHTTAATDHTQASSDHTRAEGDHTTAEADHTTADTDHTTAGTDHTRAEGDHTTAGDDHTQAGADHSRAETDHLAASQDHTTAGTDHTRAENDHTTADGDHTTAVQDSAYARQQADRAKAYSDHPWEIGQDGYIWVWDETHENPDGTYGAMVRTDKVIISYDDLTPEQREAIAQDMLAQLAFDEAPTEGSTHAVTSRGLYAALGDRSQLVFASVETCEDIIDELT